MKTETQTYHSAHTRFGGIINEEDFYTNFHATNRVSCRIISDLKFDDCCRKNIEVRNEWRKNKMSKPKLTYTRIADSAIEINLNNGFCVMAMYKTIEKEKYSVVH